MRPTIQRSEPHNFTATFFAAGNTTVALPAGVDLRVERYGADDEGGFDRAELLATGDKQGCYALLSLLADGVTIRNPNGTIVWRGVVWSVQVDGPAVSDGLTLKGMANRVRVAYRYTLPSGDTERRTTAWAEDAASVSAYGRFERQEAIGDASDQQAEAQRGNLLRESKDPRVIDSWGGSGGDGYQVRLTCRGPVAELEVRHYANPAGVEEYDASTAREYALSYGFTSNQLEFVEGGQINDFTGQLENLDANVEIVITGTASNNITRRLGTVGSEYNKYISSSMYFVSPNFLRDTLGGLEFLSGANHIRIESPLNTRYGKVDTYNSIDEVTIKDPVVVTENSTSITVIRPGRVTVVGETVDEAVGVNATIRARATRVATAFRISTTTAWSAAEVAVKLRKVGSPLTSVVIDLMAGNGSNGSPGTVLASGTAAPADITERLDYVTVRLSSRVTLQPSTVYWIGVRATGAVSGSNFYAVGLSDPEYSYATPMLYINGVWTTAGNPLFDVPFKVRGEQETTAQIAEIVTQAGGLLLGTEIDEVSAIYSNQYRDGDTKADSELLDLVASGYASGLPMVVEVTSGARLRVRRRTALKTDPAYLLYEDGRLAGRNGQALDLGVLVVGEYALRPDVPIPRGTPLNPRYIKRIEFDVRRGAYSVESNEESGWTVGGVRAG